MCHGYDAGASPGARDGLEHVLVRRGAVAHAQHLVDGGQVRERRLDRLHGDRTGFTLRETVRAGGDLRKRDPAYAMLCGQLEARPVAAREKPLLVEPAAAPHRTLGMDDPARGKPEPGRDLRRSGRAAAEAAAVLGELGAGSAVDCTI